MEEYLRRVQSRLGAEQSEDPIHVVLGGPEPDVDTLAATLCLALHLSQKEETGSTCLPLLCGRRCDIVLPRETVRYLQRVNICESSLLWREDVDLLKLHHTGKLSLTLLRDGLLDSSEHRTLESCILRVVYHDRQQDTADDRAVSAVAAVTREILQEAAEHIGPALRENLGEALRLQTEALWMKHGRRSVQLDELKRSLEQWRDVPAGQPDLEQLLTKELKEFSDGEMTIALSSVTTDKEDWHGYVEGLKLFSHRHGYEGLVVLLSINDTIHHPRQQVAVYSNNTDILNQICCELEESSSWSLSGELEDKESFQVYHIPLNTPSSSGAPLLLKEEIKGLLKDFVDCRSSVLACHPSSRTSSTEGVAGSVEFSQGSSGINDMDGSDIERAEGGSGDVVAIARVIADGQEDTGGVGVSAGGELVSPDSGMTTIRSSRSSKESSVFLSDDSPVGDIIAGGGSTAGPGGLFLRNPSPLGLSSLSPPIPPERRKHLSSRNRNDNWDLFSFDPIHSSDHSIPGGGELVNSGVKGDGEERREGSSSLSELEELSLLDFSAPNSLGRLDSTISSTEHPGQIHGNDMNDTVVPPTPVNSLVGSRPPSSCGVRFFPEDVVERISCLQHKDSVSSSLSETWDELGFDTQGALSSSDNNTWNRAKESESPQNIVEEVGGKQPVADMTERESREEILKSDNAHQRARTLEPQLSLITEQTESYDNWTPEFVLTDQWGPVTLADLQLTPPEEEVTGKCKTGITGVKEKTLSLSKNKAALNTLTPETSTEENKGVHGEKGDRQMELLDFWTYSAQKGFLKSDSGTTTSYPESLDMWNMTIRDDSLSPLTTPDNLSENSGSFYGIQPNVVGATSVESPIGFSDCGMEMWNTTIREDSSSTITSPGGPENEKNLSHTGSVDATDSPEAHATKQVEEENAIVEERGMSKALSQTSEEVGWRGNEPNVKIVIEVAGDETQDEERGDDSTQSVHSQQYVNQNLSEYPEDETSPYQGTNMWDFPVLGMVTSTSEYDNVGDGAWSLTSSPETYASPVVDMVQLEGQSSPFIALTSPIQRHEGQYQYEEDDALGKTEYRSVISNNEQPVNQVFLFEGTADSCHLTRSGRHSVESKAEETDWTEEPSDHSPFILVDCSSTTQLSSASYHSSPGEAAENRIQTEQSSSPYHVNCNDLLLGKHDNSESASSSHDLPVIMDRREDGPVSESHGGPTKESNGKVEAKITETLSLSSSSGGERDTLKYSPDSFHPGSRDELRSNSDGDSSSGLEMEYIIVSGKVREGYDRTRQGNGQSKGTRTSMETLSMLSYAATVLQSQAQAAHREHQENTDQSRQSQRISDSGCTLSAGPEQNQAVLSTHYQASPDSATEKFMAPEMISPSQSKNKFEAFHQSDSRATGCSQAQVERNYEDKSHIVARSVSPSLRYQLDDVLKTREEVYVHSQISMEDSDEDEGGQSPSALPCPTALGDFQVWGAQLGSRDTSQTTSETQSPVLTNSSVSHSSSLIGTPLSDSGVSVERGLALPFSGDLMEEENDEEEQEEGTDREHTTVPKWTSAVQSEREERQRLGSSDLLSFTEEVMGAASFQQTDLQTLQPKRDRSLQNTADYYNGQPLRTVECEKWLTEHQIGDHEASQHSYSPVLSRHQDMLSQLSSQPANENAAYLWTSTQTVTQGQTQRGYNYHHIDQRTENQSAYSVGIDTKTSHQLNTADVYAEFITDTTAIQYGSEPAENYYETGFSAEYSSNDPGSKFQYVAEIQYGDDTTSMCADDQSQYETDHAHYHFDEQPLYQSDIQPQREDHASYVSEGYVQYLLSRHPQQGDSAGGMMMNMASSEEAAEEMENTEDPPSSADLSGGSGQRRKLAAPPMNVSLNHSEESLLSEDALDTGDEALDTGDDLDVSINELNTPDEGDSLEFNRHGDEANLGAGVTSASAVAGHGAAVEGRDSRLWRSVVIGEQEHRIDMKCIEPYKRVISHGGYYAEQNAIIVFAACFLPDSDCDNYNYVMENLFLYVINTLELMVAEDYMIVYLNGATPRRRMPGFTWMKRCYQMIDRRLKKNLKMFIIVHPSWFIRTLLGITRPFISSKFSSKIKYVNSLQELGEIIPLEYVHIPASIVKADKKGNSAV